MRPLVAIIDAGTTGVRSALIDLAGEIVADVSVDLAIDHPEPGAAEQPVERLTDAALDTLREVSKLAPPGTNVVGINISAQRASFALLDAAGHPITPFHLWMDGRGAQALDELAEFGKTRFSQITGLPFGGMPALPKLHRIRKEQPEVFARASHFVSVADAITSRLLGSITPVDVTSAAWTGLFDLDERAWSGQILDAFQIDASLLPEVVEASTTVGTLAAATAQSLGLPVGTPVFAGAGDQQCSSVGAGAWEEGTATLNLGTSATYVTPARVGSPTATGMVRSAHVIPGMEDREGTVPSCGSALQWVAKTFGYGTDSDGYQQMAAEAAAVPAGSDGLRFRALFAGAGTPTWQPGTADIDGLELRHERAHIARAVIESIGAQVRHVVHTLREVGQDGPKIIAIGGGARSAPLCQILSDVSRQEIHVPHGDTQLSALRGAAAIVWRALGFGSETTDSGGERFVPSASAADVADDIFDHLLATLPNITETERP